MIDTRHNRHSALLPLPEEHLPRLKSFLDPIVKQIETPDYIAVDPVAFMYRFDDNEDRNITGFLAALLAWGRRNIVMAKVEDLLSRFGTGPANFIGNLTPIDEIHLDGFKHRTFTSDDIRWVLRGLSRILRDYGTFENFWADCYRRSTIYVASSRPLLSEFHDRFFRFIPEAPKRVRKHITSPDNNSSCKRLWLYLRWVIRRNSCVDPGTMRFMSASELMIPLDVHVARYSRLFGLLTRSSNDWKAADELTTRLRIMDLYDPAKYDYALFGIGIRSIPIPKVLVINHSIRTG